MTLVGIHHVQLAMPVGAEADAVDFYDGLLGIPQVRKPVHLAARGGCWFDSGDVRVHLGVMEEFRPAPKAHPAFLVPDLEALRHRLQGARVRIEADALLPGYNRFYAFDPFGNRLEFLSPNGGDTSGAEGI